MPLKDRKARLAYHKKYNSEHKELFRDVRQTVRGNARSLFQAAKSRAKHRGYEFSLTLGRIEKAIEAGVCEVTGLPFARERKAWGRCPWSPSIDRIDSSVGYTDENICVVVTIYNLAKSNFSHADVLLMARALCDPSDIPVEVEAESYPHTYPTRRRRQRRAP